MYSKRSEQHQRWLTTTQMHFTERLYSAKWMAGSQKSTSQTSKKGRESVSTTCASFYLWSKCHEVTKMKNWSTKCSWCLPIAQIYMENLALWLRMTQLLNLSAWVKVICKFCSFASFTISTKRFLLALRCMTDSRLKIGRTSWTSEKTSSSFTWSCECSAKTWWYLRSSTGKKTWIAQFTYMKWALHPSPKTSVQSDCWKVCLNNICASRIRRLTNLLTEATQVKVCSWK